MPAGVAIYAPMIREADGADIPLAAFRAARQAGHALAPLALPGAVEADPKGGFRQDGTTRNVQAELARQGDVGAPGDPVVFGEQHRASLLPADLIRRVDVLQRKGAYAPPSGASAPAASSAWAARRAASAFAASASMSMSSSRYSARRLACSFSSSRACSSLTFSACFL